MGEKTKMHKWNLIWAVMVLSLGCYDQKGAIMPRGQKAGLQKAIFGETGDGRQIDIYTLTNKHGVKAKLINWGAIMVSLEAPDRQGKRSDVVLGYDSLQEYIDDTAYQGAIVGRFANRIARGRFTLNKVEYKLAINDGENHLHGGIKGFNKAVWQGEGFESGNERGVKFSYLSKDGEEGYPGNLHCRVTYVLTDDNELKISYEAETDKPTPLNLTHHSYFNLTGKAATDVLKHEIFINADEYIPTTSDLIPTGPIRPVKGTDYDFTTFHPIGLRIQNLPDQCYDICYVVNKSAISPAPAATVYEPQSGRVLEVFTTEPGMQFFTENFFLTLPVKGKGGISYQNKYQGFCLEAEHFPDSCNQPGFPLVILQPGEKYSQVTIYKFSAR